MASSLEHLGDDHVDCYVLHGPASRRGWTHDDAEVWAAMERERDAGRTRLLGVSNVSLRHLEQLAGTRREAPGVRAEPLLRATRLGPRRARVLRASGTSSTRASRCSPRTPRCCSHPLVARDRGARGATPAQVVFRFALAVGMLPLTGTSDPEHMEQDLASGSLAMTDDEIAAIESLSG